jgi:hypothetical protein
VGLEACEAACGDGDAAVCLSLASVLERGFTPDLMDPDERIDKNPARALDLRRLACRLGHFEGCYELVTIYAEKMDVQAPLRALKVACERDPVCGCAFFGGALTALPGGPRDIEALRRLDNACERGALFACDTVELLAELCRADKNNHVSPACAPLRAEGRVRPPDPTWEKAPLPPAFLGCYRSAREEPQNRGTLYCFGPDRYYLRLLGTPSWDQHAVVWYRYGAEARFRAGSASNSNAVFDLAPEAGAIEGSGVFILNTDEFSYRLIRLNASEAAQPLAEIARLPRVEAECALASRCSEAVARALWTAAPESEPSDAPLPEIPTNLLGCTEAIREALDRFKRAQPQSEPPPACRRN